MHCMYVDKYALLIISNYYITLKYKSNVFPIVGNFMRIVLLHSLVGALHVQGTFSDYHSLRRLQISDAFFNLLLWLLPSTAADQELKVSSSQTKMFRPATNN